MNYTATILQKPLDTLKVSGFWLKQLKKLVGNTLLDLIFHFPVGTEHRIFLKSLRQIEDHDPKSKFTINLKVISHKPLRPYRVLCADSEGTYIELVYFNAKEHYLKRSLQINQNYIISGEISYVQDFRNVISNYQIIHPDFVGSPNHTYEWAGVKPIYPLTKGITQKMLRSLIRDVLDSLHLHPNQEWIPTSIINKNNWPSFIEALEIIHDSNANPQKAMERLVFDELLANQWGLKQVRLKNRILKNVKRSAPKDLIDKTKALLPFSLTKFQNKALSEIYEDIISPYKMMRLLQGDVGSGKTIVAFFSMLPALSLGEQVAIMVPIEILARQHFESIGKLGEALGFKTVLLTGAEKGKKRTTVLEEIASGEAKIICGTHALFEEKVIFNNLGFIVIDEQHRFGVNQRLKLMAKGENADVLVMTATPIPRTMQLAMYGDLECSKISQKPEGRGLVTTVATSIKNLDQVIAKVENLVYNEATKIYWICPLIEDTDEDTEETEKKDIASTEKRHKSLVEILGPEKVAMVHGKMRAQEKQNEIYRFKDGEAKVLVATTAIEVGVHVPDANVMIIEHAERFGLAQLHQLRGRIGRGAKEATCIMMHGALNEISYERIRIMRESHDGFYIAQKDLELRGPGDILGSKQSGANFFRTTKIVDLALLELADQMAEYYIKNNNPILEDTVCKIFARKTDTPQVE